MTTIVYSREPARIHLAELLAAELVGDGKPVAELFDYLADDFKSSPVICVSSAGTATRPQGMNTEKGFNLFALNITIFTATANRKEGYTPRIAQGIHDTMSKPVSARQFTRTNQLPKKLIWRDSRAARLPVCRPPAYLASRPCFASRSRTLS